MRTDPSSLPESRHVLALVSLAITTLSSGPWSVRYMPPCMHRELEIPPHVLRRSGKTRGAPLPERQVPARGDDRHRPVMRTPGSADQRRPETTSGVAN